MIRTNFSRDMQRNQTNCSFTLSRIPWTPGNTKENHEAGTKTADWAMLEERYLANMFQNVSVNIAELSIHNHLPDQ